MDSSNNDPSVSKELESRERRHYGNEKEKTIIEQKESLEPNASNVNVPITAAITEGRNEPASKVISEEKNLKNSKLASIETKVPKPKTRLRRYNRGKKEKVNIEPKSSTKAEKQSENLAPTSIASNSKAITKNTNETGPKTMPVTNKSERSQTKKYDGQNGMTDQVPSTYQSVKQKNISKTKPKRQHQYNIKRGLTPYQGNQQAFGTFKCNQCSTEWTSDCSYADRFQFCRKCRAEVYPFRQVN